MKFSRSFSASIGDKSIGTAGPDQIEYDLDQIAKNLDPTQEGGGLSSENFQENIATDAIIGDRIINQAIGEASANTGTLTQLFSWIVKAILGIKGTVTNWWDIPAITLSDTKAHVDASAPHTGHETPAGATAKVTAHNVLTSVHGVTTVVGTTEIQTLSNKSLGSNLAANNNKVIGLAVPTDANDASTKGYIDGEINIHEAGSSHDARYYTKTNLQTSGQAQVHWENITNTPNFADSSWKPAVASKSELPITGNTVNDMRVVANDGDGKSAIYRCKATTGEIDDQWEKLADLDWTNDHGALVGLQDDDHLQYLRVDGTRALTGDQDFDGFQALNMVIHKGTSFPDAPEVGQKFYRTDLNDEYVYKGSVIGWTKTSGQGAIIRDLEIVAEDGQTVFDLSSEGTFEVGANVMSVYKKNTNGKYELVDEDDYVESDSETITLVAPASEGDAYYFKWFENRPEVVNLAVQKDGSLQTNLNADMLDGKHAADFMADFAELRDDVDDLAGVGRTTETIKGNADDLATHLAEKATQNQYGHVKISQSASDVVPACTTADMALYIRTDGSDTNDGSANDAAHALKTVQAAISKVPQIVNHTVMIYVSEGVYAEDVQIRGFHGKGIIYLRGGNDLVEAANYIVKSLYVSACKCPIDISGFTCNGESNGIAVGAWNSSQVCFTFVRTVVLVSYGFNADYGANVMVLACESSNKTNGGAAIFAGHMSTIHSCNNTGTNNSYVLMACSVGTIGKEGTQPEGVTAEYTAGGGVIR